MGPLRQAYPVLEAVHASMLSTGYCFLNHNICNYRISVVLIWSSVRSRASLYTYIAFELVHLSP